MSDLSQKVRDVLGGDVALAAVLTGGVYTDYDAATDKSPVSPAGTPSAYGPPDAAGVRELRPFGLVTQQGSALQDGCTVQTFVLASLYQAGGYEAIRAARPLVIAALHEKAFESDGGTRFILHWLDSPVESAADPSLVTGNDRRASYEQLRFIAHYDL